ncbi:DUF4145 domain-containing protein [Pedobacter sp. NJ-S-72]
MQLDNYLKVERCPHCSVDQPNLVAKSTLQTTAANGTNARNWYVYVCGRCGGVVTASAYSHDNAVREIYPSPLIIDENLPIKVKAFLQQAIDSTFAPSGSLMLCASAVDAMLKEKGYKDGSLYKRINKAAEDHQITKDMAEWAHHVRLDANDQRHADENAGLPTVGDAQKGIDFTKTLADILFVLPSRINKGLSEIKLESK